MKKFKWLKIEHRTYGDINHTLSLIEILGDRTARFWASVRLYPTPEYKYQFCAWNKDRSQLMQCRPDADTVEEAQKEIMKYMKSNKIISEKDEVQDARLV